MLLIAGTLSIKCVFYSSIVYSTVVDGLIIKFTDSQNKAVPIFKDNI